MASSKICDNEVIDIASNWKEIQGEKKWEGLLDPLDINLRQSLLVYGSLVQAVSDAFEGDEAAKHFGDCRYKEENFFEKVFLVNGNSYKYKVTKYIYATSSLIPLFPIAICKQSSWIGYVAVADDAGKEALGRRDIVVVWRGTWLTKEWIDDAAIVLVPPLELGLLGAVHQGFLSLYTASNDSSPYDKASARNQILSEVDRLVNQYKDEELSITVTGHSLGAALTTLCAIDIAANGHNRPSDNQKKPCLVTGVAFASPRVGDLLFTINYNNKVEKLRLLKVRNVVDLVPAVPPLPYMDCGVELLLDARLSPYLKSTANVNGLKGHNLEVYLHAVAGTHGVNGEFKLEIKRPLALCNKGTLDALIDDLKIPVNWWEETKGMVQWKDGSWHFKSEVEPTLSSGKTNGSRIYYFVKMARKLIIGACGHRN